MHYGPKVKGCWDRLASPANLSCYLVEATPLGDIPPVACWHLVLWNSVSWWKHFAWITLILSCFSYVFKNLPCGQKSVHGSGAGFWTQHLAWIALSCNIASKIPANLNMYTKYVVAGSECRSHPRWGYCGSVLCLPWHEKGPFHTNENRSHDHSMQMRIGHMFVYIPYHHFLIGHNAC